MKYMLWGCCWFFSSLSLPGTSKKEKRKKMEWGKAHFPLSWHQLPKYAVQKKPGIALKHTVDSILFPGRLGEKDFSSAISAKLLLFSNQLQRLLQSSCSGLFILRGWPHLWVNVCSVLKYLCCLLNHRRQSGISHGIVLLLALSDWSEFSDWNVYEYLLFMQGGYNPGYNNWVYLPSYFFPVSGY